MIGIKDHLIHTASMVWILFVRSFDLQTHSYERQRKKKSKGFLEKRVEIIAR